MKIIGVMGSICAGKDALKDYLDKKHGYHAIKLGNILRGEALNQKIKINRNSLYKLAQKLKPNYLVKKALEDAEEKKWKKVIIGDIREVSEVKFLKKLKAKFIRVDADLEVRFKRIKNRGRRNDPKTLKEFKKVDSREARRFKFKQLFKLADYVIVNNDGYKQLYKEADKLIKVIK
jgi:dephospho-CoA kinase